MEKQYELSLVLGRLNHIHNGHKMLIDISKSMSKKTLILLGSAQESKTLRNPFSYEFRKYLIEKIYKNDLSVKIEALEDMTNEYDVNYEWGKYILENVNRIEQRKPDLMIYGKDESRKGWFLEEDSKSISELIVSRNKVEISATTLRGYLVINDKENWSKYVPKEIQEEFTNIREKLLEVPVYKKILEEMKKEISLENFEKIYKAYEKQDKENKIRN